ncbi:unnamed protein product [Allacma fusca]|uniref:Uncharacterized protein n=1 Tax=Allacma fusca TaxID=39272 RepID=A0A8J2NV97_9HEXA|nr:unnamed protein product [Allacma fusca]
MTEPLPGWNETQSSSSKWANLIFCGAYHTVLANKQGRFELTPVDYAVNTCLAAAWRLGTAFQKDYNEAQMIAKTFKAVTTEDWDFETSNKAELNQLMDPLDKT